MPFQQTGDSTKNNFGYVRAEQSFRPNPAQSFPLGSCVKLASRDLQVWPDAQTVTPSGTSAGQQLIMGIVADNWPGFTPQSNAFNGVAPGSTARGTFNVDLITNGYHPAILVDNSGTGNATITNETPLIPSRATAGRVQGTATAVGGLGTAAVAHLPATGFGSSITGGALVQSSQTLTVGGVPAAGDVYTATIGVPNVSTNPGVAQTLAIATTLSSAQAASVTTAATAVAAALNANATFAKYFVATSSIGVVTVTVLATAALWTVNFGSAALGLTDSFQISLSGAVGNSVTLTAAASGAGTFTAGGATLAGGVGFLGQLPGWVCAAGV